MTPGNKIIFFGLSGKAGAGKDTAARHLGRQGFQSFAFADAIKDLLEIAFGFSRDQLYGDLKEAPDPRFGRSPRELMQYLGTEVFRGIWPEIWIWHLKRGIRNYWDNIGLRPVVVTDVRFQDEAAALRGMGAVLIRIERDKDHRQEAGAANEHISETDLDYYGEWDYVIKNNGTEAALFEALDRIVYGDKR